MIKVNNLPKNWESHMWVVARWSDGDWWYYGVFDDIDEMRACKFEINGESFLTSEVTP